MWHGVQATPGGLELVLYSFRGGSSDGANPEAGLIADSNGNFTTKLGGGTGCLQGQGCGTVFKVNSVVGTETVLHSFTGTDGANPEAGLIADSSGNLYGTTTAGGASQNGVVFKLSPGGTETVLHSFTGTDGFFPQAGLIADSKGKLYGTTSGGGASGHGVVFKLSPSGTYTVLHSFTGTDGANPQAGLIADSKGKFYGTTSFGGASGQGVAFKLSPSGTQKVLHSFGGISGNSRRGGALPQAVIADSRGKLSMARHSGPPGRDASRGRDAAWYSSVREAGPIRCCTRLRAPTGLIPQPA